MKYVALLRGINVGGKNIITMNSLRTAVEQCGFTHVSTYIQSGNVIFESNSQKTEEITTTLEKHLSKLFSYDARIVVRSHGQLKKILQHVPLEWNNGSDLRCYIAFIKEPMTEKQVFDEIQVNDGIDFLKSGPGVLYMSTKMNGVTKSGFTKIIAKKIYQFMTMRNFTTAQKILTLMEKAE